MSTLLNQAMAKRALLTEPHPVPEWGVTMALRRLSVQEKLRLTATFEGEERDAAGKLTTEAAIRFAAELLARTITDPATGETPFNSAEGRAFLAVEDLGVLQRLADLAIDHNGLGKKKPD